MHNKILVVTNMYPTKKWPHYGVFVENTVKLLTKEGFNVRVVSMGKSVSKLRKLINYVSFYSRVIINILFSRHDVVYTHYASHTAWPILIATRLRKVKLVVNVHGNDIVPDTQQDKGNINKSQKLLSKSDKVIAPSRYFKSVLIKYYGCSDEKVFIFPSGGVNTDVFFPMNRNDAIKKLNLDGNYRYIGYVSRIERDKGWDIFLEACSKIVKENEKVKIIVVGDGDELSLFEKKVEEENIRNFLVKYPLLSQKEMAIVLNALDIFVFPTYRKSESLGLVGLEAMACETTTILPNRYGPSSYAQDGKNSFVFESMNAESLYETIDKALNASSKKLESLHTEGINTVLNFNESLNELTYMFKQL